MRFKDHHDLPKSDQRRPLRMERNHHQSNAADRLPQAPLSSPGENSIGTFGEYPPGAHRRRLTSGFGRQLSPVWRTSPCISRWDFEKQGLRQGVVIVGESLCRPARCKWGRSVIPASSHNHCWPAAGARHLSCGQPIDSLQPYVRADWQIGPLAEPNPVEITTELYASKLRASCMSAIWSRISNWRSDMWRTWRGRRVRRGQ